MSTLSLDYINTFVYLPNTINNFNSGDTILPWSSGTFGTTGGGAFDITTGIFFCSCTGTFEFSGKFQTNIVQPVVYIDGVAASQMPCMLHMNFGQTGSIIAPLDSTIIGDINTDTSVPWSYLTIKSVPPGGPYPALIDSFVATGIEVGFDFTNIPQNFNVLTLYAMGSTNSSSVANDIAVTINTFIVTPFNYETLIANSSTVSSALTTAGTNYIVGQLAGGLSVPGQAGSIQLVFPSYTNTNFYKQVLSTNGCFANGTYTTTGMEFTSLSPITRLGIFTVDSSNFTAGTSFYLYGQ